MLNTNKVEDYTRVMNFRREYRVSSWKYSKTFSRNRQNHKLLTA